MFFDPPRGQQRAPDRRNSTQGRAASFQRRQIALIRPPCFARRRPVPRRNPKQRASTPQQVEGGLGNGGTLNVN
jgi:hypothetical protein